MGQWRTFDDQYSLAHRRYLEDKTTMYYIINNAHIVKAPNITEAANIARNNGIDICNFTLSRASLDEVVSLFKTANSVAYWESRLSTTNYTQVQRYHLI